MLTTKSTTGSAHHVPSQDLLPVAPRMLRSHVAVPRVLINHNDTCHTNTHRASPSTTVAPRRHGSCVARAAASAPASGAASHSLDSLKVKLLEAVAGLDRGLDATTGQVAEIDSLATELAATAGPVALVPPSPSSTAGPTGSRQPDLFDGMWRLLYTSGFNSGSLGGKWPGPPAGLFPFKLGQIYQRVSANTARLDNIVHFELTPRLPPGLPALFGGDPNASAAAGSGGSGGVTNTGADGPALRLTLAHDYRLTGSARVEITYEDTSAEVLGGPSLLSQLPKLSFPQPPDFLKPPKGFRSASFDVVYMDSDLRITRGDRGELRVYERTADLAPAL